VRLKTAPANDKLSSGTGTDAPARAT